MSLALCYTCLTVLFWAVLRQHDVEEARERVKSEKNKVTSTSWDEDDAHGEGQGYSKRHANR
jgi:hypothetical protein